MTSQEISSLMQRRFGPRLVEPIQKPTKAFVFEVWKDSSVPEDVVIVAEDQEDAEAELRVAGILYCGGVSFTLKQTMER